MVNSVLVVGGGTAGLLAAVNLRSKLPRLAVGVVGVPAAVESEFSGYSTDNTFANHLHVQAGLPLAWFINNVKPAWKLGTRYHWGPRPFFDHTYSYQLDTHYAALDRITGHYCEPGSMDYVGLSTALMSHDRVLARMPDGKVRVAYKELAYHLDRIRLSAALSTLAKSMGVVFIDAAPAQAQTGEAGISALKLADGQVLSADLYVDASGVSSVLLGTALGERYESYSASTAMDSMLMASVQRRGQAIKSQTTIDTLSSGFSFQFEHQDRFDVGYVFSSAHQEAQQAIEEMATRHPHVTQARILPLRPGRYERAWVKNVVAVGDAGAMLEPLTAQPMGMLGYECQMLAQTLLDCDGELRPTLVKHYNKRHLRLWETIRDFHAVLYRYNTRLDTPLWKRCRELSLGDAELIVRCYESAGPTTLGRISLLRQDDPFDMEGYLDVLVGMQVPFAPKHVASDAERATWQKIRESLRVLGSHGLSNSEALAYMAQTGGGSGGAASPPSAPPDAAAFL